MRRATVLLLAIILGLTTFSAPQLVAQEGYNDETGGFELEQGDADIIEGGFTFGPTDDELGVCFASDTSGVFIGNTPEEIVWNYLISKRAPTSGEQAFTDEQVAGFMGNIKLESNFDPTALNPNGGAFGLVQWLGTRKTGLYSFAENTERDVNTIELQLDFMWFELTGEYIPVPDVPGGSGENAAYNTIRSLETTGVEGAREAAILIDRVYERSEQTHHAQRADAAEDAFIEFGGTRPSAVTAGIGGTCPGVTPGSQVVGNPYESSVNVACAPRTEDLGIHEAWVSGDPVDMRLCALNNLLSSGQESQESSIYYVEGADGRAIVNSRMSGAIQDLVYEAKADATELSPVNSSYRTNAHQIVIWNNNGQNSSAAARPGYSSHQSGVAIDYGWAGTPNTVVSGATCANPADDVTNDPGHDWLVLNAYKWGIKQYARESWHWDMLDQSLRCLFTPEGTIY